MVFGIENSAAFTIGQRNFGGDSGMKRIKLTVAYDGTNYCGWQIQPNGITIEEVLNDHLSRLLQEEIKVIGASRTDSGVHALGNVAVFDTDTRIPAEKISYALNQKLPEDIRIRDSREVAQTFHPRNCGSLKTYEYRILNQRFDIPTHRLYSYFFYVPLDVEAMQRGAAHLVGRHDFGSFCAANTPVRDMVREVTSIDVRRGEPFVTITVTGKGFLYNMVRIIAGTLIRVGTGYYAPEEVGDILAARDRGRAGPTAPARGLTLVGIQYEE